MKTLSCSTRTMKPEPTCPVLALILTTAVFKTSRSCALASGVNPMTLTRHISAHRRITWDDRQPIAVCRLSIISPRTRMVFPNGAGLPKVPVHGGFLTMQPFVRKTIPYTIRATLFAPLFHSNLNASIWHHWPTGERRQVTIMAIWKTSATISSTRDS